MSDLDDVIRARRSTRMFLPDPVPRHLVDEAVELAMRAPSNSNIQRSERGLGTCVQVSIAGYPEIVREQLDIAPELSILCGLAVGYPDPMSPGNKSASAGIRSNSTSVSSRADSDLDEIFDCLDLLDQTAGMPR